MTTKGTQSRLMLFPIRSVAWLEEEADCGIYLVSQEGTLAIKVRLDFHLIGRGLIWDAPLNGVQTKTLKVHVPYLNASPESSITKITT
jgi:hypothetical protein